MPAASQEAAQPKHPVTRQDHGAPIGRRASEARSARPASWLVFRV